MALAFDASPEDIRVFLDEAEELLQAMEEGILQLEREPGNPEVVRAIFRAAHTLKGSSATLGHRPMAEVTHAMENLLDRLRQGQVHAGPVVIDALFAALDVLRTFKEAMATGEPAGVETGPVLARLAAAGAAPAAPAVAPSTPAAPALPAVAAGLGSAGPPELSALDPVVVERLEAARARGCSLWWVVATVVEGAPMPAVRYYQALLVLADAGEVIRSWPSQEEIEQERVEGRLRVLLASHQGEADIRAALAAVPELAVVEVRSVGESPGTPERGAGPGGGEAPPDPGREGAGTPGQEARRQGRTVRVDVEVLDRLMDLVGELVIDRTRLQQLLATWQGEREAGATVQELQAAAGHIARVTAELQETILRARMLPVANLFRQFPRMVRDLAAQAQKDVQFVVRGEETELDRSVIEEIRDPLMHILRNAIDHGIEPPEERLRLGKPRTGTVELAAMHQDNRIVITVRDDGRGIDPVRIRAAAVRKGLLAEERARRLSDAEALQLIFAPGFSTAERVSEVSGRGVGLDVVQKQIEKLSGSVEVRSTAGQGTEFRIQLPLTLAIIRALQVAHLGVVYCIPLDFVQEALHWPVDQVQTVRGREVIVHRGTVVPLVRLEAAFGLKVAAGRGVPPAVFVVVVQVAGRPVGLVVDDLVGEGDVVIKPLGRYIGNVAGLAGAALLGDGRVALILDVPGLVQLAAAQAAAGVA